VSLPADIGMPVDEFFSETGFGGGHENLVLGVLDGTWDAGTTFGSGVGEWEEGYTSGNLHIMVEKGILDMDDIVELWRSPLIPNGPLMISNALPQDVKDQVEAYFTDLPNTDMDCFNAFTGGGYVGWEPVDQSFYQTIIDARRSVIGQ
jgi:phosphonate transport system substrate-binding protein